MGFQEAFNKGIRHTFSEEGCLPELPTDEMKFAFLWADKFREPFNPNERVPWEKGLFLIDK